MRPCRGRPLRRCVGVVLALRGLALNTQGRVPSLLRRGAVPGRLPSLDAPGRLPGTVAPGLPSLDAGRLPGPLDSKFEPTALPALDALPPRPALRALPRLTLPAWRVLASMEASDSEHVRKLRQEPFIEDMLANDDRRRLLAKQTRGLKELSEAYAVVLQVRSMLSQRVGVEEDLLLLDVCSGRGISSMVFSFAFPAAKIIMIDSNAEMRLDHVETRSNVDFLELDLFDKSAARVLRGISTGFTIAAGMHLCGSLSPRLVSLAAHVSEIQGLILSPCCLKAALGDFIKRKSAQTQKRAYDVLLETLADIATRELSRAGHCDAEVDFFLDGGILSPTNGLLTLLKHSAAPSPNAPDAAFPNAGVERMLSQFRRARRVDVGKRRICIREAHLENHRGPRGAHATTRRDDPEALAVSCASTARPAREWARLTINEFDAWPSNDRRRISADAARRTGRDPRAAHPGAPCRFDSRSVPSWSRRKEIASSPTSTAVVSPARWRRAAVRRAPAARRCAAGAARPERFSEALY
ncbi:hypothetical protein M885DRAFT_529940 [Pelagophyceae sp. CCMP2097]|nr:hypothetical protein M885DRAFT_529940 [Pelagophyceae sp. CCMP2097]